MKIKIEGYKLLRKSITAIQNFPLHREAIAERLTLMVKICSNMTDFNTYKTGVYKFADTVPFPIVTLRWTTKN